MSTDSKGILFQIILHNAMYYVPVVSCPQDGVILSLLVKNLAVRLV